VLRFLHFLGKIHGDLGVVFNPGECDDWRWSGVDGGCVGGWGVGEAEIFFVDGDDVAG